MVSHRIRSAVLAATSSLLAACANVQSDPAPGTPEYMAVLEVVTQVCVPDRVVHFEPARIKAYPDDVPGAPGGMIEVRRWRASGRQDDLDRSFITFQKVLFWGQYSAGAESADLWTSTDKHQPVFEARGVTQKEIVRLAASVPASTGGDWVTYWFKPPAEIPRGEFSAWQEPISEETSETQQQQKAATFWNLTHERPMEIHPVRKNAPRMRYTIMSRRQIIDRLEPYHRTQRALNWGRRGQSNEEQAREAVVLPFPSPVPGC